MEAQLGGVSCNGKRNEVAICNSHDCPIDCIWNSWGAWDGCTKTCGGGQSARLRSKRVESAYGGLECEGLSLVKQPCGEAPCPIDCKWKEWNAWTACTKSCSGGQRNRVRGQIPGKFGGHKCKGQAKIDQWCARQVCPGDYGKPKPTEEPQEVEPDLVLEAKNAQAEETAARSARLKSMVWNTVLVGGPLVCCCVGLVMFMVTKDDGNIHHHSHTDHSKADSASHSKGEHGTHSKSDHGEEVRGHTHDEDA